MHPEAINWVSSSIPALSEIDFSKRPAGTLLYADDWPDIKKDEIASGQGEVGLSST